MLKHLILQLNLHLLMSVSVFLPAPYGVKMYAEEADYILHWYCNYTQLENPVTFTAEYNLWDQRDDEVSYTRVCERSGDCQCDFTDQDMDFNSWFVIRVRAEAGLLHSKWAMDEFIPDQDVVLMPPRVKVTADKHVLTVTVSESVLSNKMQLQYTVIYWERQIPEQKHVEVLSSPHVPLSSLKSCIEYCVQVSVFSPYDISSNYSSPQCVQTMGCPFGWLGILLVLPFLGAFICYKFRKRPSAYTAPDSILVFQSAPSLPEVQEECSVVAQVISPATETTHADEEEELLVEGQEPESIHPCNDGGLMQDSGFGSEKES